MGVIIYPEKLKIGDTVATTAVSMPANEEKIDLALNNLKEMPNVSVVGLGERILRAETAALNLISIVVYEMEE